MFKTELRSVKVEDINIGLYLKEIDFSSFTSMEFKLTYSIELSRTISPVTRVDRLGSL